MGDFSSFGKLLIGLGGIIILLGLILVLLGKTGLGRLPGDIFYQKGNFTFYSPLATSLILSIILTIVLNIFFRR